MLSEHHAPREPCPSALKPECLNRVVLQIGCTMHVCAGMCIHTCTHRAQNPDVLAQCGIIAQRYQSPFLQYPQHHDWQLSHRFFLSFLHLPGGRSMCCGVSCFGKG